MAAPTFVKAGTGSTDATGAWTHTGPAPAASGNLLICQVVVGGTTAGTPTITSTTNIQSLSGTANQWTAASGNPYAIGSPTTAGQLIFFARATSTSAPVITGANSGGDDVYVRIYEFQDVNTGSTLASVVENGSAGTISNQAATPGSGIYEDTAVTTLGTDRLALQLLGIGDNILSADGSFTGETGGDWTQAARYNESGGTDGALHLSTSTASSATTINGGTWNTGFVVGYGVVGFALIGTTAAGPFTYTKANWAAVDADGFGISAYTPGPQPGPILRRRSASRFLTHR